MSGESKERDSMDEHGRVIWEQATGARRHRAPSKPPAVKFVSVEAAWAEPRRRVKALADRLSSVAEITFALAVIVQAAALLSGWTPARAPWAFNVVTGGLLGLMLTVFYASRRVRQLLDE